MLINIEGLEGASKSTSIATIQQVFKEKNKPLIVSIEPGGTPLADRCRALAKEHWDEKVESRYRASTYVFLKKSILQ